MALLVQRVSGAYRDHYYFPELAGVGVSYNTFVWDKEMDPKAGMLRLVFGLGTRAVDRVEGDYPRIVALDAPLKKPHKGFEDTRRFSQRDVDLLDVRANALQTVPLLELLRKKIQVPLHLYGVRDEENGKAPGRTGPQAGALAPHLRPAARRYPLHAADAASAEDAGSRLQLPRRCRVHRQLRRRRRAEDQCRAVPPAADQGGGEAGRGPGAYRGGADLLPFGREFHGRQRLPAHRPRHLGRCRGVHPPRPDAASTRSPASSAA